MVNERLRAMLPSSNMRRGPPQRGSPRREDTTTRVEPEMGGRGRAAASEKSGPEKEPVLHSGRRLPAEAAWRKLAGVWRRRRARKGATCAVDDRVLRGGGAGAT